MTTADKILARAARLARYAADQALLLDPTSAPADRLAAGRRAYEDGRITRTEREALVSGQLSAVSYQRSAFSKGNANTLAS